MSSVCWESRWLSCLGKECPQAGLHRGPFPPHTVGGGEPRPDLLAPPVPCRLCKSNHNHQRHPQISAWHQQGGRKAVAVEYRGHLSSGAHPFLATPDKMMSTDTHRRQGQELRPEKCCRQRTSPLRDATQTPTLQVCRLPLVHLDATLYIRLTSQGEARGRWPVWSHWLNPAGLGWVGGGGRGVPPQGNAPPGGPGSDPTQNALEGSEGLPPKGEKTVGGGSGWGPPGTSQDYISRQALGG